MLIACLFQVQHAVGNDSTVLQVMTVTISKLTFSAKSLAVLPTKALALPACKLTKWKIQFARFSLCNMSISPLNTNGTEATKANPATRALLRPSCNQSKQHAAGRARGGQR